jgi:hypothetical protein
MCDAEKATSNRKQNKKAMKQRKKSKNKVNVEKNNVYKFTIQSLRKVDYVLKCCCM